MESALPAIIVVLSCWTGSDQLQQCLPTANGAAAVTMQDVVECELRVKRSRSSAGAEIAASCSRGTRVEARGTSDIERADGRQVIASVFY